MISRARIVLISPAFRWIAVVTVLIGIVFVVAGCVPSPRASITSTPTYEEVPAQLASFYHHVVTWEPCNYEFECATVTAPQNWENPETDSLSLALIRRPAKNGHPIGSLFVNPGGPGASGYSFVADSYDFAVSKQLQENFDIVGFDPRGVGRSTPVTCLESAEMDAYLYDIPSGSRGSDEWITELNTAAARFTQACQLNTGPILNTINTHNVARDLDMLRAILGDSQLYYLGYSYGTSIGVSYAKLFPNKVGRLALDGAIDPTAKRFDVTLTQAQGFESALRSYMTDCVHKTECPFTQNVENGMSTVQRLLENSDVQPLAASDGRKLGATTLVTAIIYPLYQPSLWPVLSEMFTAVINGNAEPAFTLADAYNGRNADGSYQDNSSEAFIAVNCLDYDANDNPALMREQAVQLAHAAPIIGPYMGYGDIQCATWSHPSYTEHGEQDAIPPTSTHPPATPTPPILVVGTTNDPATPYVWAEKLAQQLDNGFLITYRGEGHTAYNKSNNCVTETVDTYLLTGQPPPQNLQC